MNKDDILSAAFRAWGREGYKKMSLSEVAAELGVTKPALYRHFRDKERILAAMRGAFFDRYVQRLRSVSPSFFAGSASTWRR
jgi:AcrR family transcriptional regulator